MALIESTTVTLDREREFALSFGTLRRFEKESGKTLPWLINELGQLGTEESADESEVYEAIGILIWAGVVKEDPELTTDQVFDMLPMYPVQQVRQIFQAINAATIEASKNGESESPLAAGSIHGPSVESS